MTLYVSRSAWKETGPRPRERCHDTQHSWIKVLQGGNQGILVDLLGEHAIVQETASDLESVCNLVATISMF